MYHRRNRRSAVIASVVVVVLLLGGYVFVRKPYAVYATEDTAACSAGLPLSVTLSGSDAPLVAGESRAVTVKASAASYDIAHLKVGYRLLIKLDASMGPSEFGSAMSDEFVLKPGASVEKTVNLTVPAVLPAGDYSLEAMAFDGTVPLLVTATGLVDNSGQTLTLKPSTAVGSAAMLAGDEIERASVATGEAPPEDVITQQFLQYALTSAADASVSVRWRVYETSGGERTLLDDATYTQDVKAGTSQSRLFFLDPTKFASGDVQTDVTSNGLTSTAHMFFTGSLAGLQLGEITQHHQGGLLFNQYTTAFCVSGTRESGATLKLSVSQNGSEVWSQVVPVTHDSGHGIKLASVLPRKGVSVTAVLTVNGIEIARRTNDFL